MHYITNTLPNDGYVVVFKCPSHRKHDAQSNNKIATTPFRRPIVAISTLGRLNLINLFIRTHLTLSVLSNQMAEIRHAYVIFNTLQC